jgi:hypothetical protein
LNSYVMLVELASPSKTKSTPHHLAHIHRSNSREGNIIYQQPINHGTIKEECKYDAGGGISTR